MVLNRYLRLLSALPGAVVLVSGCASAPNQSVPVSASTSASRWLSPAADGVAFEWVPTDALDLKSPMGTYVRAAIESSMIIAMTTDRSDTTPGFVDSVRGKAFDWIRDLEGRTKTESWIGTEALRILVSRVVN